MQADHSALGASVIVGPVWGVWHLPLGMTGTESHPLSLFPAFLLAVIASSVFYTWMYNSTGGSLLIVVLVHAAANLPLAVLITPLGDEMALSFWLYVAMLVIVAVAIVVATGPAHLSRTQERQVARERA